MLNFDAGEFRLEILKIIEKDENNSSETVAQSKIYTPRHKHKLFSHLCKLSLNLDGKIT